MSVLKQIKAAIDQGLVESMTISEEDFKEFCSEPEVLTQFFTECNDNQMTMVMKSEMTKKQKCVEFTYNGKTIVVIAGEINE